MSSLSLPLMEADGWYAWHILELLTIFGSSIVGKVVEWSVISNQTKRNSPHRGTVEVLHCSDDGQMIDFFFLTS